MSVVLRLRLAALLRVLAFGLVAVSVIATGVQPAAAAPGDITITGHGYGHGRGMSQWGAYGYAVDRGAGYQTILDLYYGGTRQAADAGNPVVSVELLGTRNRETVLTGPGLAVNGVPVNAGVVRLRGVATNTFEVTVGDTCAGPWRAWAAASTVGSGATVTGEIRSCEGSQVRAYRGSMTVVDGGGFQTTVNNVPVDDYLRGVVPREMPAGWGSAGAGRGMEALKVQAVAARSYALSSQWTSYAKTCDTTSCQVYGGAYTQPSGGAVAWLEDSRTDSAINATTGQVRRSGNGAIVRTEFSSSTGGWTAGGVFPAVEDLGDATSGNPNHNWTVTMSRADVSARLSLAGVSGLQVTQANGLGADGGRALQVTVTWANGQRTYTGNQIRSALGLKSDWFSFPSSQNRSVATALYADVLGRAGDTGGVNYWTAQLDAGVDPLTVARGFAASDDRFRQMIRTTYALGLRRAPDPGGAEYWLAFLRNGGNPNDFTAAVWSVPESVMSQGGGLAWVDGLYGSLLGRSANADERGYWNQRVTDLGRTAVVLAVSTSAEAREMRLNQYYVALLGRGVDPVGRAIFSESLSGRGDIDVVALIASSPEYVQRAVRRY
ncbi:hypothetical protein ASG36_16210 [Geodermatophilus sp. Leaf369]|uniref:SpoIID/LytB domain-containing protein n=1 Tax=Geodermatophilus sp. Leaf369 TaxID=1736354 RepID=UPI0006FF63CE|nr:SpoIID/LytB domain-containing protein [Geodermatophilus sp. Leaf369]KQS58078.1 hypothetical protein ASG36_16210 [Geodermatophilus sp. Leaf369]